jgi:predicted metal-dependent hydrolase
VGERIEYVVRVSPRAKQVRLKISLDKGLVVVIPYRFPRHRIPEIIGSHQEWIERTLATIEKQRAQLPTELTAVLPERITLPAINRQFTVEYRQTDDDFVNARIHDENRLVVSGAIDDVDLCREVLGLWLKRMAQHHLVPWLCRCVEERQFTVKHIIIRAQRTRWASCSQRGTVSLNQRMLMLPPDLVEYLFIHELCHTIEMNHSQQFWALVASHDPGYKAKEKRLHAVWRSMPVWA